MEPSIPSLPRAARRRLMRVVHKTRDKDHARRALAILRLAEGLAVSEVARQLCAARSTVYRWWGRFECEGERGLESTAPGREPVFYVDEADIDLNPRIGAAWMRRGQQTAIPTPGTNQKRYLAGALDARTGAVLWTEALSKGSELLLALLRELRGTYRSARRIVLIVDNYIIHRSQATRRWLEQNPKFELLFQPVYQKWTPNLGQCRK